MVADMGRDLTENLGNGVSLEMVSIPGGSFSWVRQKKAKDDITMKVRNTSQRSAVFYGQVSSNSAVSSSDRK